MPAKKRKARITTGKSKKDGQHYNRLKAANNRTLMVSEGFPTRAIALKNEQAVIDAALEIAGVLGR